jgi:hypothetical protein
MGKIDLIPVKENELDKEWILETILQEQRNCHLYEKCGFVRFGGEEVVNDKMTLITYRLERNAPSKEG